MNPVLRALGFDARDRVAVLHVDDLGLCHATLPAYAELSRAGAITSASLMAPCPWFFAAAELARDLPGADLGLHLTLTCEWPGYRWGPLSTRDPASGLLAADGASPSTVEAVTERAAPAAVAAEWRAQVARAAAAGLDLTHLDSHMYCALEPAFLPEFVALAADLGLPAVLWPGNPGVRRFLDSGGEEARRRLADWRARGVTPVDHGTGFLLSQPDDREERARRILAELPPGLTHVILHPAAETPEIQALAADWRNRVEDTRILLAGKLAARFREAGVHLVGYGAVRDAARQLSGSGQGIEVASTR